MADLVSRIGTEPAAALPEGWERHENRYGEVYYAHLGGPLPAIYVDSNGVEWYDRGGVTPENARVFAARIIQGAGLAERLQALSAGEGRVPVEETPRG